VFDDGMAPLAIEADTRVAISRLLLRVMTTPRTAPRPKKKRPAAKATGQKSKCIGNDNGRVFIQSTDSFVAIGIQFFVDWPVHLLGSPAAHGRRQAADAHSHSPDDGEPQSTARARRHNWGECAENKRENQV